MVGDGFGVGDFPVGIHPVLRCTGEGGVRYGQCGLTCGLSYYTVTDLVVEM